MDVTMRCKLSLAEPQDIVILLLHSGLCRLAISENKHASQVLKAEGRV